MSRYTKMTSRVRINQAHVNCQGHGVRRFAGKIVTVCSFLALLGAHSVHAALPGHTVVSLTSPSNSNKTKTQTVSCPSGTVPISVGYQLGGSMSQGKIHITKAIFVGTRSVEVEAIEGEDGFSGNWTLEAKATCANALPGLQRVSATYNSASADSIDGTTICPGTKIAVGGGFEIVDGDDDVMPTALDFDYNSVRVVANEDETGTGALWSLEVHAFCADNTLAGHQLISAASSGNVNPKQVAPGCPAGQGILAVGGIAANFSINGDISVSKLNPYIYNGTHSSFVRAEETLGTTFTTNAWLLRGEAICADL